MAATGLSTGGSAEIDASQQRAGYLTGQHSVRDLLAQYALILEELRVRGVVRSTNNPVADYTEWLVARTLGLELETASASGFDAKDKHGTRYQIKGRRLTPKSRSRQLSAIRLLRPDGEEQPFDFLAAVLYEFDFTVQRACLVPVAVILTESYWSRHVNGWWFFLRDAVWDVPGVWDITTETRSIAEET